eukprot:5648461-Alexandrium_andersonii.AAC.1
MRRQGARPTRHVVERERALARPPADRPGRPAAPGRETLVRQVPRRSRNLQREGVSMVPRMIVPTSSASRMPAAQAA